jgi:hypothetical protein
LPLGASPSLADGLLLIGLDDHRGSPTEPARLVIEGSGPDIVFDPPRITLDITQGCLPQIAHRCGAMAEVVVRGRQARALLRQGSGRGLALLNNSDGGSIPLVIENAHERNGLVVVDVRATAFSEAGRFSGAIPIEPATTTGPSLLVDVRVRWALSVAIFTVFLGSFVGGFLRRRYDVVRRRTLLEVELGALERRFRRLRRELSGPAESFDIDGLFRTTGGRSEPFPQGRDLSAALWEVTHAREEDDFKEATGRVEHLATVLQAWERIEPVARRGNEVLGVSAALPEVDQSASGDLPTLKHLGDLLLKARQLPATDAEATKLAAKLAAEVEVGRALNVLWAEWARLLATGDFDAREAERILPFEPPRMEADAPSATQRETEAAVAYGVRLRKAEEHMAQLRRELRPDTAASTPEVVNTVLAAARGHGRASGRRIKGRARGLRRLLLNLRMRLRGVRISTMERLAFTDVLWSLVRGLVAVMAYTLVVYNDTWGTTKDFVSAFAIGFASETIVDWALMPAFQTFKNRRSIAAPGEADASPPAEPDDASQDAELATADPHARAS